MLKRILVCFIFFLPNFCFALSCPNNGAIVSFNDSTDDVLQACGKPDSIRNYQTSIITSEEMTYYVPNVYGTSNQVTLLINNDHMINADVISNGPCTNLNPNASPFSFCSSEANTPNVVMCGTNIGYQSNAAQVIAACGLPQKQNILGTSNNNVTEFHYKTQAPNTLVFVNGYLSNWQ